MNKPRKNRGKFKQFTNKQHYLGKQFLKLFARDTDKKFVKIAKKNGGEIQKSVEDKIFCSKKAWDESSESLMKRIEDDFKLEITKALADDVATFNFKNITDYYLMWTIRGKLASERPESVNFGIVERKLTHLEQDVMESKGSYFLREDGTMHDDMYRGLLFSCELNKLIFTYRNRRWGLVKSPEIDLILPDFWNINPWESDLVWIIPITRNMAFIAENESGIITQKTAQDLNELARSHCNKFCVI